MYYPAPTYTEIARRNKTIGRVKLQVEYRRDGTVGDIEVIQKLGDGLDDQAIKAIRRLVFLPPVRNGQFVTITKPAEVEFNLR
jgi:TonB family protein